MIRAALVLWKREMLRFLRQPARLAGFLGTPLLFWVLIGSGFEGSFALPGADATIGYLEYYFPGTILLVVLFTAIYSSISVVEDRNGGFLQGVLVSPASPAALAGGIVSGSATMATGQAALLLALAPAAGITPSPAGAALAALSLAVIAAGLSSLGFLVAWRMRSAQGFHAVMNLLLIPLWLLSGALFPPGGAAPWLRTIIHLNPLRYGMDALRQSLYLGGADPAPASLPLPFTLTIISLCSGVMFLLATAAARNRRP